MPYSDEALKAAQNIIDALKGKGRDLSAEKEEIARAIDEGIWEGNWDTTTEFTSGAEDIRLIQEDEYDQSMDDDEKPDLGDQLGYGAGCYIFPAN